VEIIEDSVGKKAFLLGNEAIARGALEAGVDVVAAYPGTPSSEIADTFSMIAVNATKNRQDPGFYFEYSTNEKVALEIVAAASLSGLRSLTCMKHVGLNVASDALITYLYVGCKGGNIIVSADDPYCHSSQNEQDNRYYSLLANMPMFEPSSPHEAKEMTRKGFEISEKLGLPILLRTTTRLNHVRGIVTYAKLQKHKRRKGRFEKDPMMVTIPIVARARHPILVKKMEKAAKLSDEIEFNKIINIGKGESNLGIVTSGVSFNYVMDALKELNLSAKILKLGMTNPLPKKKCEKFIKSCDKIIVIEELEPFIENQIKAIAHEIRANVKIYGKSTGHFSRIYEYNTDIVRNAICKILDIKRKEHVKREELKISIPNRPPVLCAGCPHRATYYAVKLASKKDTIYPTDIGCYTLGKFPPLEVADVLLCMGSNAGMACGFAISTDQKIISFMGDSTFFHAGIPALIDAAHHTHNCVITVLDNRTTAMTGHQPHPGTEYDGMGKKAKMIKVEDVARGVGIEHVEVVNPKNLKETTAAFKRALKHKGPSVIVSKSPCILLEVREKIEKGIKIPKYEIDQEKCTKCKTCVSRFGCVAFYITDEGAIMIDEEQCNGCAVCVQVCPFGAIRRKAGD
jgi:indolepyruvate ferredoxin oxidoreductase alpha subunit